MDRWLAWPCHEPMSGSGEREPGERVPSGWTLQLARQVTGRHNLDDVLVESFRLLRPLVTFSGGSIQLVDADGWIYMAASDPIAADHVMAARVPIGSSVAGRVILTEQPVYLPNIEDEAAPPDAEPGRRVSSGVRSYLGLPLIADGRAIGLLQLDSDRKDAWSERDRELLLTAASIVAAAIQNARAFEREAAAQRRVDELEERLADAGQLIALARNALRD